MANVMDYLDWRGDLTLTASPFNEVDNFICSMVGTLDYTGVLSGEQGIGLTIAAYDALHGEAGNRLGMLASPHTVPLVRRLPKTERFRELRLRDFEKRYDAAEAEQFSAVTICLPDGSAYLSYRGTDDTIAGWKEDFLMSVTDEVPAQRDALDYLLAVAAKIDVPLRLGGHSKGGNLAVYAAVHAPEEIQKRILSVYNNDGPGFRSGVIGTPAFDRIRARLQTILPQHALVGLLMEQSPERCIVESSVAGPLAHDGFNWQVKGTRFVRCEGLSLSSRAMEDAVAEIQKSMDEAERETVVDAFFDLLSADGAETLTELSEQGLRRSLSMLNQSRKSPQVKEFLSNMVEVMLREYAEEVRGTLPELKWPKWPTL